MKKLNHIVNIIMGSLMGAFVGRSLLIAWRFKTYPELYAMQSAPWYTAMLLLGIYTLFVVVVCYVIKVVIKWRIKKSEGK